MPKKGIIKIPPQTDSAREGGAESAVLESRLQKIDTPAMYQVVVINDDYTPMEFVVEILQKFFSKGIEEATQIMLGIHHQGKAICGIYPRDVAATKVTQVMDAAQQAGHPLQCAFERI